ncbi:MAG TPA: sulfatase-like hydrolase/transferase [Oceanipulchritudo sp.]|nr:sulfatase-like hydrolase/transferase [Oceanipulchritudo sp.]
MTRILPCLVCLLALAASNLFGASEGRRPNILMILVDDLGYGDLSCQGSPDMQTPAIDRLFAEGMRFGNFYANCTVCSPSRASLLTGRYPDAVGVPGVIRQDEKDSWGFLDPEATTIADVLAKAGYATGLVGKWHLGLGSPNVPNERGFDSFKGFLGDMMEDYWTHRRGGINWMRENEQVIDPEGHATDLFAAWASEFVRSRAGEAEPFFLYLAFNAPHDPVQPPAEWLEKVQQREKGIDPVRARLVAFIEHLDARIGNVLQTLEVTGLAQDTLVVFSSDNGGALRHGANNGPLRGGKGDHFEGGIRVPMAATWPGHIEAGSTSDNIGLLMDLFPTFCAVAGVEPPGNLDGISLLPTLTGKEQATDDRVLFWVRQEGNMRFGGQTYYAARYKHLKILQNTPWEPYAFYDLAVDPMETAPLEPVGEAYTFLFRQLMEHIRETTVNNSINPGPSPNI